MHTCHCCKKRDVTPIPSTVLQLPSCKSECIQDLINNWFKGYTNHVDYRCSGCASEDGETVEFLNDVLAPILFVQLPVFNIEEEKVNGSDLTLANTTSFNGLVYNLVGIIYHIGITSSLFCFLAYIVLGSSISKGLYIAAVRNTATKNTQWVVIDDSNVEPCGIEVPRGCQAYPASVPIQVGEKRRRNDKEVKANELTPYILCYVKA